MKRVFVDSGGFFSLLVRGDSAHEEARRVFEQANAERWTLVTTNTVVVELCDAQSFVVMEGLRIREAIAADGDFRQYGLRTLL